EERAKQVGALGHITKPFEAQSLVERVNEILAGAGGEPEAAEPEVTAPGELTQAFDAAIMGDIEDPNESTQDFSLEQPSPVVQLDAEPDFPLGEASETDADFPLGETSEEEATAFILPDDDLLATSASFAETPDLSAETMDGSGSVPNSMNETIAFIADDNSPQAIPEAEVAPVASLDDDWGETSHDFSQSSSEDSTFATAASEPSFPAMEDTENPTAEDATFVMPDGFDISDNENVAPVSLEIDEEPAEEATAFIEPAGMELDIEPAAQEPVILDPAPVELPEAEADNDFEFGGTIEEPWEAAQMPASEAEAVAEAPAANSADLMTPEFQQHVHETLEKLAWEAFSDVSEKLVKDALQRVEAIAWEVIPQMAEALIKEEISKLKGK
ncbi:MAG: hypothetical protein JRC77_02010, partial [Deltaproteobacteria bacterium]|nr:hypothetical protein [Deltaproteobacteria bacterium]